MCLQKKQSSKTKSVCVHVCLDFHEMIIASAHSNDTGMWPGQSPEKGQRRRILRTYNVPILCTGNDVPKIIINGTINLFLKTAMSFLLISNRNNFRVLFDKKIASVYFTENIYLF